LAGNEVTMTSWLPYVLVGVGGFVGANARFVLARWVDLLVDTRFPLGTLVVNVAGSFALGVIGTIALERLLPNSDEIRLAVGVGFLGAFTTFSTFGFETHALLEDGSWATALVNILVSVAACLIAVRAGVVLARAWLT
jgi:CrcB protein